VRPTEITKPTFDPEVFHKTWEKAGPSERSHILARLSREKVKVLAEAAPSLLERETSPSVAASLIKVFFRDWPSKRLKPLLERLGARQVSLRMAALEALIQIAPESLVQSLPNLLKSKDTRLRILAIKGLARINIDEALRHLEVILLQGEPGQREAGFQCALLLPFENTRNLLVKVFAAETDCQFLKKIGNIFQTNPDPEVPFKLWEIAETSPPEKAEVTKTILEDTLSILEKSGILKEAYSDYLKRLHDWINKRYAVRVINDFLSKFLAEEGSGGENIAEKLRSLLERPGFRETVEEALNWPIPAEFRGILTRALRPADAEKAEARRNDWESGLSLSEKIAVLSKVKPPDAEKFQPIIGGILANVNDPPSLKAAALRAALRLDIPDYTAFAKSGLTNSDVGLSLASLDYLSTFAPFGLLPILQEFLRRGSTRQKSAAFRILNKHFPAKAVETIAELLEDSQTESHIIALMGIVTIDFSLTRDHLTAFLARNPDSPLFEQCLLLFQNNPEFENLYSLYKIEHSVGPDKIEKVRDIKKRTEKFLIQFRRLKPDLLPEFEEEFEKMLKLEKEREKSYPEYSIEALFPKGAGVRQQ